jgi:hypothetical protein
LRVPPVEGQSATRLCQQTLSQTRRCRCCRCCRCCRQSPPCRRRLRSEGCRVAPLAPARTLRSSLVLQPPHDFAHSLWFDRRAPQRGRQARAHSHVVPADPEEMCTQPRRGPAALQAGAARATLPVALVHVVAHAAIDEGEELLDLEVERLRVPRSTSEHTVHQRTITAGRSHVTAEQARQPHTRREDRAKCRWMGRGKDADAPGPAQPQLPPPPPLTAARWAARPSRRRGKQAGLLN